MLTYQKQQGVGGKKNPPFKPSLFEHTERQIRSVLALAIARVLVTNDFKNTEKVC